MSIELLLAMAAVTFATRYVSLAVIRQAPPPEGRMARWLRLLPVAIFAALATPSALAPHGPVEIGPNAAAALVALLVALRTRQALLTLTAGMAVFWLLRALGW